MERERKSEGKTERGKEREREREIDRGGKREDICSKGAEERER